MTSLPDQVRAHCAAVCTAAQFVTINQSAIAGYASGLEPIPLGSTQVKAATTDAELEAARLVVLTKDAINFGSGWHDVITKAPGLSGAKTMSAAVDSVTPAISPQWLKSIETDDCLKIFGQEKSNPQARELMALFAKALNELGHFVTRHGGANAIVEAANGSAVSLATQLTEMEMFDDVGFYKRAQICAADLARQGLAEFDDLADLTAFADNLVPHVLIVDEVVSLDEGVSAGIANGELLQPAGLPETELRAVAVHVVELLSAYRDDLTAADIDEILWHRGGQSRFKAVRRPRCRSIYY